MLKPRRVNSPIKWFGGKYYLARKIVELIPEHVSWTEGYGASLAVTLLKAQHGCERIIEANNRLTNFWKVLADEKLFKQFKRRVEATPFSNESFASAAFELRKPPTSKQPDVVRAVNFFVTARMSRQGLMEDYATATKNRLRRGMNENVSAWLSSVEGLEQVHNRIKTVEIICGDVLRWLPKFDTPTNVYYGDPPYMHSTRTGNDEYKEFEVSDRHHAIHLEILTDRAKPLLSRSGFEKLSGDEPYDQYVKASERPYEGKFILSGYNTSLYTTFMKKRGFNRIDIQVSNSASSKKSKEKKTECLWTNF